MTTCQERNDYVPRKGTDMQYSILTHNGCVTITNPATGNHRTVRIKTQPKDSAYFPGERVVQLMVGPDNERSFRGFGFVKAEGIRVWNKFKNDSFFRALARMLESPEPYEKKGVVYQFDTRCRVCNRLLTNPESIQSGIGPDCAGR